MFSALGMVRAQLALSAVWLGALLSLAFLATPTAFAVLTRSQAGAFASAVLAREAQFSLVMAALLLLLDRALAQKAVSRPFGPLLIGTLLAVAFTVLGGFVLAPYLALVKADPSFSALTFGQWHAVSVALFAAKILAVAGISWQLLRKISL